MVGETAVGWVEIQAVLRPGVLMENRVAEQQACSGSAGVPAAAAAVAYEVASREILGGTDLVLENHWVRGRRRWELP